ncbi:hypothetical protein [Clostridium sp. M14]|uniref:hypothetical protein n=1 Tax=Clostridium sp. M14 TaxID=2716311 RepID=UPI0013EEA8AD|nr:hypothetical protein [Clostridium sp. M14]MBZ9693290.1 hypothetical protein [Clostridium sp. M14]
MSDKSYTIFQVMELLKNNKELIFEIRNPKEKDGWYEHMLLMCVRGITGNYGLQFYLKLVDTVDNPTWITENYIPFSEKVEWYISTLTRKDIQKSIDKIGIRNRY